MVSGHVYDLNGKAVPNQTFNVLKGGVVVKHFTTDRSGTYGVYLDPGDYTVQPQNNAQLEGRIRSYPQPVHQDIHLQRKP